MFGKCDAGRSCDCCGERMVLKHETAAAPQYGPKHDMHSPLLPLDSVWINSGIRFATRP